MTTRRAACPLLLLVLWTCSGGAPAPSPCKPAVQGVVWDGTADPAVSRQMKAIAEADGADRSTSGITLATLLANDEARRVEALSYLQEGKIAAPADLFHAAAIFARGTCPDHLELAVRLARRAWERGSAEAWALYVQTGVRWMEAQGKKPRVEEGRLRAWPVLEDLNQRLWSKGDGTFAVPLKLPATLEPKRAELEAAVRSATRKLRQWARGNGWECQVEEGFIDRVAVLESKAGLDRVVNQLRETAPADPVDPFLAGLLQYRALVILSPEAAANLHPAFSGALGWEQLLTMAMARQLHRRVVVTEAKMGPPWFREGFAGMAARLSMRPFKDFRKNELLAVLNGTGPLDPQACIRLHILAFEDVKAKELMGRILIPPDPQAMNAKLNALP